MNRRLILALTCATLVPLAVALAAHAQPPGPPPGAAHGPPAAHMAEMKAAHEAMQKQHIEDLKLVLRLRPDQEAALAAFMASHEPKRFEMRLPGPDAKPKTTPERLDEMAKREAAMDAERDKHRAALAKFYAALSPEQQKTFDALQRLQHGPRGMGDHGGPGMRRMILRGGPGGGHGGPGGPIMIRRELHP